MGSCYSMSHFRIGKVAHASDIGRSRVRDILLNDDYSELAGLTNNSFQDWLDDADVDNIAATLCEWVNSIE